MESPAVSETTEPRKCPQCSRSAPEVSFYKKDPRCRNCIQGEVDRSMQKLGTTKLPFDLPEDVERERHRQAKLLRIELKRVAKRNQAHRERLREARKKKAAVEKLLPEVKEGEVEVDAVTKELAARVLQRRRLIEFVKEFHPKYKPGWVHVDICQRLEKFMADVEAGRSPRLMILMPPRHGKSQIASKLYPAWHLGHCPDHEIIACSYNLSLALEFSREVRGTIRSDRYKVLFPRTVLDKNNEAAESWKIEAPTNTGAGGYTAAGIGGPINGKGAHVLIIDDPIKNAEEAESIDHLRKIHGWYDSTAYTRLAPGGGVLIIQTWWSDNDLAGRVQEEMKDPDGDQFEVIKYPAIAVQDEVYRMTGEALHPERYPLEALEKIRKKLGGEKGKYWNALYQQNPTPDDGAYFTKDMFVFRSERPDFPGCHIYQAWDFGAGEKRQNDWTVGITIAVDWTDTQHVVEMRRFKTVDQLKIASEILAMYASYPHVQSVGVEKGQTWTGIKAHFTKLAAEGRLYPVMAELQPLTQKTVRALPLQGRMQQRKVTFPHDAAWVGEAMKELLRFPNGMHDDIVDALAWCITLTLGRSPPRQRVERTGARSEDTVAQKIRKIGRGVEKSTHMAA
jgi:predicted phage terminase large subunit-like protein